MLHVFVETNWFVAFAAPAHMQVPAAVSLVEKARIGALTLHLPALCLTEAKHPLRTKFQPRAAADSIRKYLAWATRQGNVEPHSADTVRAILDQYEMTVSAELDHLGYRLEELTHYSSIDVFALSEAMLAKAVQLSTLNLELKPFDQAILAAVLVRAEELHNQGASDLVFCEIDSDLQPWDKNARTKQPLAALYASAGLRVHGDFAMEPQPGQPD